jgi:hypothetical protein
VLLDALDALAPHRGAFVVVGAQAVYLRTGTGEIGIAPSQSTESWRWTPACSQTSR